MMQMQNSAYLLDRQDLMPPPSAPTDHETVMATLDEYYDAYDSKDLDEAIYAFQRLRAMRDRYEWERQQEPNPVDPCEAADHVYEIAGDR